MSDKDLCAIFAKNLTNIMTEKSIKQIDIVNRLHVAKGTVSAWCSGQNIPRTDALSELLQFLGVELSDLLLEKTPTPGTESGRSVNTIKIAGRNGSFREKRLDDKGLQALIAFVDLLPDAPDNI